MRQTDTTFIDMLREVRYGSISPVTHQRFLACDRPIQVRNGILPTVLYSRNINVDEKNNGALMRLPGKEYGFKAVDTGDKQLVQMIDKNCSAPSLLRLKVGAQVVLLRNLSNELVNGSRGVVVDFVNTSDRDSLILVGGEKVLPRVRFDNGQEKTIASVDWKVWNGGKTAFRQQLPLKLAWALTVHRAQGMTLDKVECSLSDAFDYGQVS